MTETVEHQALRKLVITPRPLSAYRDMFLLTDDDLVAGPILDCPGGASPFALQVRQRGGTVVSVDPHYRQSRAELAAEITGDLQQVAEWTKANPGNFDWSYMGSPKTHAQMFEVAAELFLTDYSPDGRRYFAAELPELPFADGSFRLTLSSHLLFCYADYLDYDQHLAAIRELMRVTTHQLRLFPLVDREGRDYQRMAELRAELAGAGIDTEEHAVPAAYVAGGARMMTCTWRTPVR